MKARQDFKEEVMEEKKKCGDVTKFVASPYGLGDKHPLHGQEIECELEPTHFGNHSGKAKDGTPYHWRRAVELLQ